MIARMNPPILKIVLKLYQLIPNLILLNLICLGGDYVSGPQHRYVCRHLHDDRHLGWRRVHQRDSGDSVQLRVGLVPGSLWICIQSHVR